MMTGADIGGLLRVLDNDTVNKQCAIDIGEALNLPEAIMSKCRNYTGFSVIINVLQEYLKQEFPTRTNLARALRHVGLHEQAEQIARGKCTLCLCQ